MSVLDAVKQYITALSDHTKTQTANAWLVQFEKSHEAWEIIQQLLMEPAGSPHRYFSAIMLHNKSQRDLTTQLNPQIITAFTQNLVSHLIRIAQEISIDMGVCRYLCLSIAAVAVQVNENGIVQQILQWLNPILATHPAVVLELLIVLPEEGCNRHVLTSSTRRRQFLDQLSNTVPEILGFLNYILSAVPRDSDIGSQLLKCLERWIDNTSCNGGDIVTHQFLRP